MLAALGRSTRRRIAGQLAEAAADSFSSTATGSGGSSSSSHVARHARRNTWQEHLQTQIQPSRLVATAPPAGGEPQAAVLAKARRMAGPVGVLAGVFGSIVGVGGGVIIVPTIVSACKTIPQRVVSGTSLAAVVSTALASAYTYSTQGCVDLSAAALISPAAMLTAPLGARLTTRLNCTALRRILGYFLLCAAPMVPLKAYLLSGAGVEEEASAASTTGSPSSSGSGGGSSSTGGDAATAAAPIEPAALLDQIRAMHPAKAALLASTGAVAGIASGLLGVGGGLIVTPLLAMTMPYAQATVLGTSLLSMIPPATAALVQHNRLGNVDWRMAAALAMGTAVGSVAGSNLAVAAPDGWLEFAFCVGMLFLGRKTLQSAK